MKEALLDKYVRLIVRNGVNVQKGQGVNLYISTDLAYLARKITREAYAAGAAWVQVEWQDQEISKMHYQSQTLDTLGILPKWKEEKLAYEAEILPCKIVIESEDPDGLQGVDSEKLRQMRQMLFPQIKPYREKAENKYQWVIAGAPSPAWAGKIFPDLGEEEAVEALWEAIFDTSRILDQEDPLDTWARHNASFEKRTQWLNAQHFSRLYYKSENGTDFHVDLLPNVLWAGGGTVAQGSGIFYQPNIPTEEIFTSPWRGKAEGKLVATKPLSYQGQLIDGFWIEFAEGKAVRWGAEQGEELLGKMLTLDEGASYIGEVALVPYDSPINQKGYLFWNTLFDENACCHVAIGCGFTDLVQNYSDYTREEIIAMGINDSMTHVDFMVGSPDLEIIGELENGDKVQIFTAGTWADTSH